MGRMLDVAQAAKRLGVCERTVRRMIANESLPAIAVGAGLQRKSWRIDSDYLEDAIRRDPTRFPGATPVDPGIPGDSSRTPEGDGREPLTRR